MKYSEARWLIQTGDMIAVQTGNPVTRFFQWLGRKSWGGNKHSNYTHVGITEWISDRLMIYEMDGRYNVFRPLSQYANKKMAVFDTGLSVEPIKKAISDNGETAINYDAPSFITKGVRILTGLALHPDTKKLVCSEDVRLIYENAGYDFPADFLKILLLPNFVIYLITVNGCQLTCKQ